MTVMKHGCLSLVYVRSLKENDLPSRFTSEAESKKQKVSKSSDRKQEVIPEGSGQMFIKRCITGQGDASVSKVFATQIQGLELRFPISILES